MHCSGVSIVDFEQANSEWVTRVQILTITKVFNSFNFAELQKQMLCRDDTDLALLSKKIKTVSLKKLRKVQKNLLILFLCD